MKKIYLLFTALLVITCAKEEDPIVTAPASNELPPPSFTTTPFTPLSDFEYNGGDITIATREDFLKYRDLIVEEVSGDLNLNVDWDFYEGSSGDPSRFTSTIKEVTGNVTINTIDEFSMESLLKVGGDYSVTGADVIDDNLIYAQSVSLDYDGDYVIKSVYTDAIELNLDAAETAKAFINTSKLGSNRNVDITAFHTDLINIDDIDLDLIQTGDVSDVSGGINSIPSNPYRNIIPEMPDDNPVYTEFRQISDEPSTSGSINSDNISSITIGGHINVNKISSDSCTDIYLKNTELPSIEVFSMSVVTFEMPNLTKLFSIALNLPRVEKINFPVLTQITNISVTGVSEFLSPLLETLHSQE